MKILAIETSCDETATAVLENDKILSSVISSQIEIHKQYGGVYPELASRAHLENILPCIELALKKAKVNKKQINEIAVTTGPGLIGSLLIGVNTAKTLAYTLDKPIIGINHLEGHIYSDWLTGYGLRSTANKDNEFQRAVDVPTFPALCLIVSGGHTSLILMSDHGKYQTIGQTRDDAAGEAFDKVGKLIGLPYPGGPEIEKIAKKGDSSFFDLPRAMLDQKNYDFSFSGLKTAVLNLVQQIGGTKLKNVRYHLAASFQKAVVDVLIIKTVSAAKVYQAKSILISGGVSSNNYLRKEFEKYLKKQKISLPLFFPPQNLTTDNAAMIGSAAYFRFLKNKGEKWYNINANANANLKL